MQVRNTVCVLLVAFAAVVSANIQCYQCTSNENPTCNVNDASSLTAFKKACPPLTEGPLKGNAALGCRKITQSIESELSVVRECAYSGTPVDGLKKTGNHGIQIYYYQCENESAGTPCNSVGTSFSIASILSVIAVYLLQ